MTGGWSFISDKSAKIAFQTAAGNQTIPQVPQGKAGVSITFSDEEAIVFAASGGNERTIANIYALKQRLLRRGGAEGPRAFPQDFAVVTDLVTADATTVLLSERAGGEYVASAEADFKAGLVDLANLSLGISVAHSRSVRTELDASKGATPLFRGVRLKRRWWIWLGAGSLEGQPGEQELPFDEDPFGED